MNDTDVLNLIREALFEVAPTRSEEFASVQLETTIDDLALDSIALMEMVGFIEDKCETTFEEDDLAQVKKVADLARLIRAGAAA